MRSNYYNNEHVCGNCNGSGQQGYMDYCRECGSRKMPELAGWGRNTFPVSRVINGCKPPYIQQPYAWRIHPLTAQACISESRRFVRVTKPAFAK